MKVKPISRPLDGEHIIGVHPTMQPNIEVDWHRRLNLFTGRALSDAALTSEQEGRAGSIATRSQMISRGIVSGLETTFDAEPVIDPQTGNRVIDPDTGIEEAIFFYSITPGLGLAASGEDVLLPTPLRLPVRSVPVYAPVSLLENRGGAGEAPPEAPPPEGEAPEGEAPEGGAPEGEGGGAGLQPAPVAAPVEVSRAGLSLGELIDAGVNLPRVGVLVLQPITAELIGRYDPKDPCEQAAQNYAFEDWQRADGCRLLFYTWPTAQLALPQPGDRWRNRIAYSIFEAERLLGPDEILPWEEIGVPIALVAFDERWNLQFIDRHSVARAGGKPKRRAPLLDGAGNQFLWQARLQQFAEHLTDADFLSNDTIEVAKQFRYLPPAGLLPKDAVELLTAEAAPDVRVGRNKFFPSNYRVEVSPAPLEQLDVAMESSASLAPFDTFTPDRVEVVVPVPETVYEPSLLIVEKVAPDFQQAIDEFNAKAADWSQRRKDVRRKAGLLAKAITGKEPVYSDPDPDEDAALDPAEEKFGVEVKLDAQNQPVNDAAGKPVFIVAELENLRKRLDQQTPLTDQELAELDLRGLKPFINFLESKVDQANDKVDFGFLRVQTDIYRIRQHILGNVAATRLATSPALAQIAKGDSAVATKEDIEAFLNTVKGNKPKVGPKAGPAAGGAEDARVVKGKPQPSAKGSRMFAAGEVKAGGAGLSGVRVGVSASPGIAALAGSPGSVLETRPDRSITDALKTETSGRVSELITERPTTTIDIRESSPIIGEMLDFRTVTIAERLETPPAVESKSFSVAGKYEVLTGLGDIGIAIDDIPVPGVPVFDPNGQHRFDEAGRPLRETVTFGTIKDNLAKKVLDDPIQRDADEAAFFAAGVGVLESAVATLRGVERRVQDYKAAIELCRATLEQLKDFSASADRRLAEIENELAESRHDLAVATALLAEETERIRKINERRDLIIREHVKFLAFYRSPTTDLNLDTPARSIDPGLTEMPVPACLEREEIVPAELRAMIALLRESPVTWFTNIPHLLTLIDRLDSLREAIVTAKERAIARAPEIQVARLMNPATTRLGLAIEKAYTAQHEVVSRYRLQTAQIDLSAVAGQSWRNTRDRAKEIVSLGDLIDGGHGRSDVAQRASRELADITRVAGCLYAKFAATLPAIRLDWAERLSQYDGPVNLRNLAALPRWGEIAYLDRREAQAFVDWLYQRVDARLPEAVAMINDVVRVCLLLASHAPVNQIIAGHVPKPTTVSEGGRVELAVDHTKVRIGMHVLMYSSANQVIARGVVEDLFAGRASARVVQTAAKSVSLEENARAQFSESQAFNLAFTTKATSGIK